jgi:gliding motility-associated-like protein
MSMPSILANRQLKTYLKSIIACILLCAFSSISRAQIIVTADKTAAILAGALVGTGVTILSPTLNCPGNANGLFTTGIVDPMGIPFGIVLTNGCAKDTTIGFSSYFGVNDASSNFASCSNGTGGDVDLTALAGHPTFDACVLEFDFKAAGDTIRFNYLFGSEEYTDYTCTAYNDVFGFFISGGGYLTPTNLALVPGTTIPVCINSVNCGPTTFGTLSNCTALGPGSPFCAYYVDNIIGFEAPYVTYDGLTTRLTAIAAVNPCDTYHLKLGVADATDHILDSGVFIEGGSLASTPPPSITAVGTSGLPYCIRGCAPGNFSFNIPAPRDTNTTVHYVIMGTAVNGYDYTTITDSVVILATTTTGSVVINPLLVPAVGPKVVTLGILMRNPCTGLDSIGATASLTILDSFGFHIVTPDTTICLGQHVNIIAVGDTIFAGILHYIWSPSATINNDTLLTPIATPVVTTTYTLRDSTAAVLGCPVETRNITITVYSPIALSVDSALVKTCVGVPVHLHVYAIPSTANIYNWSPATDLNSSTIWDPIVTPSVAGDVTYVISVSPIAAAGCISTATIRVHTLDIFTLNTNDTAICINTSLPISLTGSSEFSWSWTPSLFLSSSTVMQPVVSPTITTPLTNFVTYIVTGSYAHCPNMVDSFHLEIDYLYPTRIFTDTICLGFSDSSDFRISAPTYFHYQWTPATYLSNDTIPYPVITPTVAGNYSWTLLIQPHAVGCTDTGMINMIVTPNSFTITPTDTSICKGAAVQVVGTPYYLFHYQWLPTAGIPISNIINPLIIPDTSAQYVVTASFPKCPLMRDTLMLDVQPNPTLYIGGNRFVCEFDSLHIHAYVNPRWYTHYIYSWSPASFLDSTTTPVVVFSGNIDTMITLTVSTPKGCSAKDSAHITVHPGNFAKLDTVIKDFCPHDLFTPIASGGATYHWYPALYLSDSLSSHPVMAPITSQSYSMVATSIYGCRDTLYFRAIVHPGGVINIGDSVILHPGETYQMDPLTNCTSFEWFPPAGLSNWQIVNPLASPEISTQYTLYGQTQYGCKAYDSISIYVDVESLLALPNAFSPGSGPNSEFKIIKRGIATLKYFRIFNRWGNMVFETTDIDKGWDGTYKGVSQPLDVYVYQVEAVTSTGKIFLKHGNTTLIK